MRVLGVLVAVLVLVAAGFVGRVATMVHDIARVDAQIPEHLRPSAVAPPQAESAGGPPLTILIAGVDNGDNPTGVADAIRSGQWQPGRFRSDTLMVLHLSGDRRAAYVVSIPRDTLVPIEGHGRTKINAAFSYGGMPLMQLTVEQFTGVRMDHVAIVDWYGLRDLSLALGGVTVTVAEDVRDPISGRTWTKGTHNLQGSDVLAYVRMRYGLTGGDLDRIQRQQNVIREMLRKLVSAGTLANPLTLSRSVEAITSNVVLDSGFTDAEIRDLAVQCRGLRPADVHFLTAPIAGASTTPDGASVLLPKVEETRELFAALARDDFGAYLQAHPDVAQLRAPDQVR
ncbi:MAG: LCP family protein [Dermatophilaceae bacterium]